jgi:hypothetical protein
MPRRPAVAARWWPAQGASRSDSRPAASPSPSWAQTPVTTTSWATPGAGRRPAAAGGRLALDLAAPEGHRRAFVEGGTPVRLLLADHLHWDGAHHLLVGSLLERLRMATPPEGEAALAKAAAPPPLVAPLSEREQVVLRYLSSRLSAGRSPPSCTSPSTP